MSKLRPLGGLGRARLLIASARARGDRRRAVPDSGRVTRRDVPPCLDRPPARAPARRGAPLSAVSPSAVAARPRTSETGSRSSTSVNAATASAVPNNPATSTASRRSSARRDFNPASRLGSRAVLPQRARQCRAGPRVIGLIELTQRDEQRPQRAPACTRRNTRPGPAKSADGQAP